MRTIKWRVMGALAVSALLASCGDPAVVAPGDDGVGEIPKEWTQSEDEPSLDEVVFGKRDETAPTIFDVPTSGPPIVATWSKVIGSEDLATITAVEEDRVVFGPEVSEAMRDLELMEIISSTDENSLFLRRVLRVEPLEDGSLVVHTRDAAVTEAILHGSLNFGQDTPLMPTSAEGLITHGQRLEIAGHKETKQFKLNVSGNQLSVEGEFPVGTSSAIIPAAKVSWSQQPEVDAGFDAEIEMGGSRGSKKMCDLLQQSDESHYYTDGWLGFGAEQEIPPAMRKLMWALHWAGNTRAGGARLEPNGSPHIAFNGTIKFGTRGVFGYNWGQVRPNNYVQMRPEFVEALEIFERRVVRDNLQEHFVIGGPYLRQTQAPRSRQEIISYYERMIPTLDSDVRVTMRRLISVLRAQSDDLQWISTSLAVAREYCQGQTKNANAAVVIRTAISVEGSVEFKTARTSSNLESRLSGAGFSQHRASGGFRKNLIDHSFPVIWLFPGGFPVAIVPTFLFAAVVPPAELSGQYKMEYGPYELVLEAGYNQNSGGGAPVDESSVEEGGCQGNFNTGLCGGLLPRVSAGQMKLTSREARFTASAGLQFVPEFLMKFYGVAGIGAAAPLYTEVKAEATGRVEASIGEGAGVLGKLCLSNKTGFRVHLLGRLDSPFALTRRGDPSPLAEVRPKLYDSCDGDNAPLCLKLSGGFRAGAQADSGITYADPSWSVGDDSCPSGKLEIKVKWNDPQDLDIEILEPNGEQFDRNNNSELGGVRTITKSCCHHQLSPGESYEETAVYGESLGAVQSGKYTFWVVNSSQDAATSGTIEVVYTDTTGNTVVMDTHNFSTPAGGDWRSQRFSVMITD